MSLADLGTCSTPAPPGVYGLETPLRLSPAQRFFCLALALVQTSVGHPAVIPDGPQREHAIFRVEMTKHRQAVERRANGGRRDLGKRFRFGLRDFRFCDFRGHAVSLSPSPPIAMG